MRRLLMFLVEKINKSDASNVSSAGVTTTTTTSSSNRMNNLNTLIVQKLKKDLKQFWIPPYCKVNSLRIDEDDINYSKEGCKMVRRFNAQSLSIPTNFKSLKLKDIRDYYDNYCLFVTEQAKFQAVDLLSSLIEENKIEKLKEQDIFNETLNLTSEEIKQVKN
jgi:hypothetical protein